MSETTSGPVTDVETPDGVAAAPTSAPGYDLLDRIGRGGMGDVYRARDRAIDREVAVKVLQARFAPDSPTAVRFVEEARITGQLQHPGIPAVYRVGTSRDGRPSWP
jgi:serine/threonine protein kinase